MWRSLQLIAFSSRFHHVFTTVAPYTIYKKASLMIEEKRRYISYLLRLWQIKEKGKLVWRASLESPGSGERAGFGSLEAVFHFLRQQTETLPNDKKKVEGVEMPMKHDDNSQKSEEGDV
jgi:hypothetical protein